MVNKIALASILALLTLFAPATFAQHPNMQRGFAADQVFNFGNIDNVNIFSGGLVVNLPIGIPYPVGGNLSYGFNLFYAGHPWDYETVVFDPTVTVTTKADRYSNAGMGWHFSLGRLKGEGDPFNELGFAFQGSDGNDHRFYTTLDGVTPSGNEYGYTFTRDGSYLRLSPLRTEGTTNYRIVEFPDGKWYRFDEFSEYEPEQTPAIKRWRLQSINDRHGNKVTIEYLTDSGSLAGQCQNESGGTINCSMVWRITDTHRTHKAYFKQIDPADARTTDLLLDKVELASFGGTPAVWRFTYAWLEIEMGMGYTGDATGPWKVWVQLLTGITGPESGYTYSGISHYTASSPSGHLKEIVLPTKGKITWDYGIRLWPNPDDGVGGKVEREHRRQVMGVKTRVVTDPSDGSAHTWTYTRSLGQLPTVSECPTGREGYQREAKTTVQTPDGDESVHYFSIYRDEDLCSVGPSTNAWTEKEYGLPVTHRAGADLFGGYLSTELFDCAVVSGTHTCESSPLRKTYAAYQYDALADGGTLDTDLKTDNNRRLKLETTHFPQDPGCVGGCRVDVVNDQFDGYGHYKKTTTSGNFGAGDTRVDFIYFLPPTSIDTSFWFLGKYDERWTQQIPSSGTTTTAKALFCTDPLTGAIRAERRLKGTSTDPTTVPLSGADVVNVYIRDARGNITSEYALGGELGVVSTTSLCNIANAPVAGPGNYLVNHTYAYGSRKSSQYSGVGYFVLDQEIDAQTGLPNTARDSALVPTTLTFDKLGRLTKSEHPSGAGFTGQTEYQYSTSSVPAKVSAFRKTNDSTQTLTESEYLYDGLGRLWREKERLPTVDHWKIKEIRYHSTGAAKTVSEYDNSDSPTFKTTFESWDPALRPGESYDPLGRPLKIHPPDAPSGSDHTRDVSLDYKKGVREIARTVGVGKVLTSSIVSEQPVTTTEIYDPFGRLYQVIEPIGSGLLTEYSYDVGGRLSKVCSAKSGSACPQTRLFSYDNRGFLTSESHPEKSGTVNYNKYDAKGHLRESTESGLVLAFDYNTSEQLTDVREVSPTARTLKKFTFAASPDSDATNKNFGKLTSAVRYNHERFATGINIRVTENFAYRGKDGAPSEKVTLTQRYSYDTLLSTYNSFVQRLDYNDLGQIQNLGYPACTVGCVGVAANRTVLSKYTQGRLSAVHRGFYADFTDVPPTDLFHNDVETLVANSVTVGCTADTYCRNDSVTRMQIAIFIARSKLGSDANVPSTGTISGVTYNCSPLGNSLFADVAASNQFCKQAHWNVAQGIMTTCANGNFCPAPPVSRGDMAMFIARAVAGSDALVPSFYTGPSGRTYNLPSLRPLIDMENLPSERHAHYIWARDIIDGCTATTYCPGPNVTRLQMSKFLVRAFNLTITTPAQYATSISYHDNGLIKAVTGANGVVWNQDNSSQMMQRPGKIYTTGALNGGGAPANWDSGTYGYDSAGNVIKAGGDFYLYDASSRLLAGTADQTGGTTRRQDYLYDNYGNLTQITTKNLPPVPIPVDSVTNRLSGSEISYDPRGNLIQKASGKTFSYDGLNMMKSLSISATENWLYFYTASDERIWAYNAGAGQGFSEWKIRNGASVLREYRDTGSYLADGSPASAHTWSFMKDYIYRGGSLLAVATPTETRFFHADHLGTPRLITNPAKVGEGHTYYPFGQEITVVANDDPMKFTGHERDRNGQSAGDDSMDYMHARYYSPTLARFFSVDPAGIDITTPQSWNRYSYVRNNPILRFDPDGRADLRSTEDMAILEDPDVLISVGEIMERTGFNKPTLLQRAEHGTIVTDEGGGDYGTEGVVTKGSPTSVDFTVSKSGTRTVSGKDIAATIHSHPGSGKLDPRDPKSPLVVGGRSSSGDRKLGKKTGSPVYILNEKKNLIKYDPATKQDTKILTGHDYKKYVQRAKKKKHETN